MESFLDIVNKEKERRKVGLDKFFISKAMKSIDDNKLGSQDKASILRAKQNVTRYFEANLALIQQVCQREIGKQNQLLMESNKLHG